MPPLPLVDTRGSEAFFARLTEGVGTLRRQPGQQHEIVNELDARPVFADLRAWLQTHALAMAPPIQA